MHIKHHRQRFEVSKCMCIYSVAVPRVTGNATLNFLSCSVYPVSNESHFALTCRKKRNIEVGGFYMHILLKLKCLLFSIQTESSIFSCFCLPGIFGCATATEGVYSPHNVFYCRVSACYYLYVQKTGLIACLACVIERLTSKFLAFWR